MLPDLIQQATVIATPADPNAINHASHFSGGPGLTSAPAALNAAIALQLADLPGAPSAGGVMFSRDGSGDALHNVYGTSYSARGVTLGRGRLGGAITFQDTNYETLDGANIRDGGINFLFTHAQCCGNTNDVLQQTVYVRLNRKVTSFVVNYGLNDRLDVGVVVPIVQVTMAGRIASRILRVGTVADPSVHCVRPAVPGHPHDLPGRRLRPIGKRKVRRRWQDGARLRRHHVCRASSDWRPILPTRSP